MEYRRRDVRDPAAFRDVDVVVPLAFMITGNARRETMRVIDIDGTLNTFRVAAEMNVKRFVRVPVVGGRLRLPPREPGRDDRAVADAAG